MNIMTYRQIIENNCSAFFPHWWPKYAYHFSDVTNIVSILSLGTLFSRAQATRRGVMENDNASKQVIDITETRTTSYVRFYFRPLTPTQYYNEGYKHFQLRYSGDQNANIPVPVFLVFDLESLLKNDRMRFSPLSQAGYGSPLFNGEEDFSKLPFDKIYSNGWCEDDTRKYRHAEILCPDCYAIDDSLRMILCRNECEKTTLLNMLFAENQKAYYKYKDLVRIARDNVFQRNGLYVENVNYHNNTLAFEFACTPEKKKYEDRQGINELAPLKASFKFQWTNRQGTILYSTVIDQLLNYLRPYPVMFKLPSVTGAYTFWATLLLDGKVLCVFNQSIDPYELL